MRASDVQEGHWISHLDVAFLPIGQSIGKGKYATRYTCALPIETLPSGTFLQILAAALLGAQE
jgi:hypothetical protein